MAAGDVKIFANAAVAAANVLNLQADSATEIVIHNITVNVATATTVTKLQFWDGTNAFDVDSITGSGSWMGMFLHCTNTAYYRVVSAEAGTKVCADGMVTKA